MTRLASAMNTPEVASSQTTRKMIPVTENSFLASCRLGLAVFFLVFCGLASAEGSADYEAGRNSYLQGDLVGAMTALRRASDAGDAEAQALLGYILDKAEFDSEAIVYFKKSADQGNAEGLYGLGTMYLTGEGGTKDLAEAGKLLRAAAERGHVLAINTLALAYIERNAALGAGEQDSDEARRLLIESADENYLPAMEALSNAYLKGGFGLKADPEKAAAWQEKIAKLRKPASKKN